MSDFFDLKDKVALVTGAAQGIGKNIARKLLISGARVYLADCNPNNGRKAESELRGLSKDCHFLLVDLSKPSSIKDMFNTLREQRVDLSILINNAKSGNKADIQTETVDNWDLTFNVSLRSAFLCSQLFIESVQEGAIVNIGSIASALVCPHSPSYHASKAGLEGLTRYLAVNAGPRGVRVNAILPGFIVRDEDRVRFDREDNEEYRTVANECHPLKHIGSADDIADAVAFLCSNSAKFISGQCLIVDGALSVQEQSTVLFNKLLP